MDKEIKTQVYQMSLWHKKFAEMLNIVVIVKTNLQTNKTAQVVLFRSDLTFTTWRVKLVCGDGLRWH